MTIRVNGNVVPERAVQYELDRLVKFYSAHMPAEELKAQYEVLREKAKQQAIGARLLVEQADRLDIRVPSDEVEERLKSMIKSAGGGDAFQELCRRQNMPLDMVRQSIEQGRRVDRLVEQVTADVSDPTEAEMKAHFEAHSREYRKPDRAQAQHILIRPGSDSEADRQTARSRLEEIRRHMEDGADFADEATAYSECPSGRKTGGSLGWVDRGMVLPELDEAIFSMEIDTLSEIVETPLGFHLVRKTDAEEGGPAEYEDVADKIRNLLRHVKRGEAITAYVEELREKAVIEES